MGTHDLWESATMGWYNIGVQNYKGEEGRLALINGNAKFTDPPYVKTYEELAKWAPYLPEGYQSVQYIRCTAALHDGTSRYLSTGSWKFQSLSR
jgi:raffinose/stachyose/melibiose transport system substrate-binding protein